MKDSVHARGPSAVNVLALLVSVAGTTINAVCAAFGFMAFGVNAPAAVGLYGLGLAVGGGGLAASRVLQRRSLRTWWWLAQFAVPLLSPALWYIGAAGGLVPFQAV